MRIFNRRRVAAMLAFAAASASLGGAAQAVLNDLDVNVSDVIDDLSVSALSDIANDLHLLACDQTNVISNDGEANRQENTQTNRCSISVVKLKDTLNDLSIDDLLANGVNVLSEGN
ncbi:MAG: hypothetical protein ACRDV9_11280 [Acidimicrobiia bacterium]